MFGWLSKLRQDLVIRVAKSFLLKHLDGYKTEVLQVVNGIKMVIVGAYGVAVAADYLTGAHLVPVIDAAWAYYIVGVNFLTDLGMDIAIEHSKLKEAAGIPQRPVEPKLPDF